MTGGSGNLGGAVTRVLVEQGFEVLNLDKMVAKDPTCETRIIDIRKPVDLGKQFRDASAIVHLAAYQSPENTPHEEVFQNNVTASYNVFKVAHEIGVPRVVHASSVAVYGFLYAPKFWQPQYLPLDENYKCRPQDPYSLAKRFGEKIADSFIINTDLTAVSLRLSGVNFDPEFKDLPRRWQDPARKMGTFWSYIDARDAAGAVLNAITAKINGHEIFNIAHQESRYPIQTRDLVLKYLPKTRIRRGFNGCWGGLDTKLAADRLNFVPRYHWRDVIDEEGKKIFYPKQC